jgi:hypothetical protein
LLIISYEFSVGSVSTSVKWKTWNKQQSPQSLPFLPSLARVAKKFLSSTQSPSHPTPTEVSAGVWTQGLHLEPFQQPFFVMVFFWIRDYLSRLASNRDPSALCLLSS